MDLIRNLISRPATQSLFLKMLKLSHAALNYGGGQGVRNSGEIGALHFLRRQLSKDQFTVFDVGANDGDYLSAALDALPKVQAHSFEPQQDSFEKLKTRFAGNPAVQVHKLALGRAPGTAQLQYAKTGDTTASLAYVQNPQRSETVEVSTVDLFCRARNITHIDLLKIDTEGFEMDVLLGAHQMIERDGVAAIQFEFGDTFIHTPYHFADFWELLTPRYRVHRILRSGGTRRILEYSTDLEIYKTSNFLCVLR